MRREERGERREERGERREERGERREGRPAPVFADWLIIIWRLGGGKKIILLSNVKSVSRAKESGGKKWRESRK